MKKPNTGLLHVSPDWRFMSDFTDKLVIPSWIVISQRRPDIFIFSKAEKTCIIIELTWPCKENIEVWHQKKFEKYEPLITSIKSNDSVVHLFAIKVNAKGYCSKPGKSCLSCLGFSGKHLKSTIKQLNLPSLKASFQIWFSRDYKRSLEEKVTIYPTKTFSNVVPLSSLTSKISKTTWNCQEIQAFVKISCILNKCNSYYINTTLQCLSTMVQFWSSFSAVSKGLSPFMSSFMKICQCLFSNHLKLPQILLNFWSCWRKCL